MAVRRVWVRQHLRKRWSRCLRYWRAMQPSPTAQQQPVGRPVGRPVWVVQEICWRSREFVGGSDPCPFQWYPPPHPPLQQGQGRGQVLGGGKDNGNGSGKGGCKSGGKSGGGGNVLEAMQAMGRSDVAAALRDLGLGRSADRIHQSSKGMGGMNGVGGLRVRSGGETGGDGGGDGWWWW